MFLRRCFWWSIKFVVVIAKDLHPRCPGGVWAADGLMWTACGRSLFAVHKWSTCSPLLGEIHGLSTRSPANSNGEGAED